MDWFLLHHGIGIDFQEEAFHATCVKRQWSRIRVIDRLEIPQYKQLGPLECGKLYRKFLRKNGLKVPWTVVALPRSAVLLRSLAFPRAVEKELARAVEYQLEALHPFEEGSVYWDFSVLPSRQKPLWGRQPAAEGEAGAGRLEVAVAIAEKKYVEETASWFQEAGIAVSQFTVTTALLFAALGARLGPPPPIASGKSRGFFIVKAGSESFELIGYAPGIGPGIGMVTREIPIPPEAAESADALPAAVERELALARAELRVDPEERPPLILCGKRLPGAAPPASSTASENLPFAVSPVEQFFPSLSVGPESFRLREHAVGFAAALGAADRRHPLSLNLLPAEKRSYQSPLVYLPTYALSALVVLLAAAVGLRGSIQDSLYSRYLEREIQALRPQLREVEAAQEKSQATSERLALLGGVRNAAALPLAILNELTRLLPEDVWLQQMQYAGDSLALNGTAQSASGLLQALAGSDYFESPEFSSAINTTPEGREAFRIRVRLRTGIR